VSSQAPSASRLHRLQRANARFPGALLLYGASERALDEASLALAASLLCPGDAVGGGCRPVGPVPAADEGACQSCRRALHGFHPDLFPVEPEGVQIRVDRVREAIAFAAGRPYESAKRVVRIRRAELLGLEAANALLKSLEEPGAHVHWILTTSRPESLLATIRSRCLAVPVGAPGRSDRVAAWKARGFGDEDAADLAVIDPEAGEDAPGRLEEFRQFRSEAVEALAAGIVDGKLATLVLLAEKLGRAGEDELALFTRLLADAALLAAGVSADLLVQRAVAGPLSRIAKKVGPGALARAVELAADVPPDTRRGNRRLHFEKVLIDLWLGAASGAE
jgi:DNA polymerase-3 subunit delta'